jgi:virginiamycin B lyase
MLVTLMVFGCAFAIAAPTASAKPSVSGKFAVSGVPGQITQGPDGNIWVTLSGSSAGNDIAKVTPAGVVTEFDPADVTSPVGITSGPDGNIWVTQAGGVAKIPPAAPNTAQKFTINDIADPRAITAFAGGNLWTASGDKVIKIPPANPAAFKSFTVNGLGARGIAAGRDGRLWVADFAGGRIARVTRTGDATFFDVGGAPQEVAAGPRQQIAYGNPGTNPQEVGRITPGGSPQTTQVPQTDPFGITLGADGAYWIAQFAGNNLGRLTTDGKYSTLGGFGSGSGPRYLTSGPNNTLWVSLETAKKVARVTGVKPIPETTITQGPADPVRTTGSLADVRFRFRSSLPDSRFDCSLRKKGDRNAREQRLAEFRQCTSPKLYDKLRLGGYNFVVRAVAGGERDPTPATWHFRIVHVRG